MSDKKENIVKRFFKMWRKFRFLLEMLVSRDFKAKYKRSVLGVFWSFLNPLLMMLVQYVVFYHVFRSDIKHYPAYLLSGTVLFNFFNEATSIGISSISSNAHLLTKVYLPKPIFPIARALSSGINLALSCIPLLLIVILTGVKLHLTALLFPLSCVFTMCFTLGMIFFLSTVMVFFRDIEYLWRVVSLLWMYATPIFYAEKVIPGKVGAVLLLNPMRHYLSFARQVLIYGQIPPLKTWAACAGSAVAVLFIGLAIFRRHQDKFVIYL